MQDNDIPIKVLKGGSDAQQPKAADAKGTDQAKANSDSSMSGEIFKKIFPDGRRGSLTFILQLLTVSTPYFIVFFFIFVSIINSNIKGFIYVIGLIFVYLIINIFKFSTNNPPLEGACLQLSEYHTDNPAFVSGLYSYTIIYMLLPMIFNNTFNILFIIFLFIFFTIDIVVRKITFKCLNFFDIFQGVLFGVLIGGIWSYVLKVSGNKELLYYEDILSNKETCTKVKNNFTCNVYKNGQLLNSVIPQGVIVPK